jgi:hypothetical protein
VIPKIKVKAKNAWSVSERRLVAYATDFAVAELGLDVSPVPIHIYLKGNGEADGDAIDLGHKIVVRIFKREEWLATLFHELEHARQYIYCELELEYEHVIWHGTLMERDLQDPVEYLTSPWEVAAREMEVKLLTDFRKKLLDFDAP